MSALETSVETYLWPVTAFRVRLLARVPSELDPFERLILELATIGQTDPVAVADMTGLEESFVRSVVSALMVSGSLRDDRTLTDRGRRRLENQAEPQVIPGWMLRDDISGRPLPTFLTRLGQWPDGVARLVDPEHRQTGHGRAADWMRPFVDWRRRRGRGQTAADAAVDSVESVSVIGDGVVAWMPVDLWIAEDGRGVRVDSKWDVESEVLEARLADAPSPPEALRRLEEHAAERRRQYDALLATEELRVAVCSRLAERIAGRTLAPPVVEALRECENLRCLLERGYIGHATLLTQQRKLAEVVAGAVSPQSLDALERGLSTLPKPKEWAGGWGARFEALAQPETLALPTDAAGIVANLKAQKQIPNHGQPAFAWPFVAAVLAPNAPTTRELRAACRRFPALWLEFESLRRGCNPSAHGGHRGSAEEVSQVDAMVVRVMDAIFPVAEPKRGASVAPVNTTGVPAKLRALLDRAAASEARVEQDALATEQVLRSYAEAAMGLLNELAAPPTAAHRAAVGELSDEPEERIRILRRRLDGLVPPDDDGCGFEVHEALVEPLRALATDLDRRGLSPVSTVVWPLVAAVLQPDDDAARRVRACLAVDRDFWKSFTDVSAAVAGHRPTHGAAERLRTVARARDAVERLLAVRRTAGIF